MMRRLDPHEVLRRAGIRFVTNAPNGKFLSNCPECGKLTSNAVEIRNDLIRYQCQDPDCGASGILPLYPARSAAAASAGGKSASASPAEELAAESDVPFMRRPETAEERRQREAVEAARREFDDPEAGEEKGEDGGEGEGGAQGSDDGKPTLRVVELPVPSLAWHVAGELKRRPDGPFDARLLEQFARLVREKPGEAVRLAKHYPALACDVKLDAATVKAALLNANKETVGDLFAELAALADLDAIATDELRRLAAEKSAVGLRVLSQQLKAAQAKWQAQKVQALKLRRRQRRIDPRPMMFVPAYDAPWLPEMERINGVLSTSTASEPPMRDIDGYLIRTRKMALPGLHLFSSASANQEESDDGALPPPEQWLLHRMGEVEAAELIEAHIDYLAVDDDGVEHSVHLQAAFVKHYERREDDALPIVVAIATLPLVLGDGALLAPDGLDRARGIMFKVPRELRDVLPRREDCGPEAVRAAMRFLTDDWLVDVATDYAGKCVLIAAALTLIERSLLPVRPAFWGTAGKAGGGKTTMFTMLVMAVTGSHAAAAAWSSNEEERRKALLSYFMSGVSYILWDNIPRGELISCPHVEKSCTSAYYSDRRLGVSEMVATAASTIHFFTGNNIAPCGDLASRSLQIRLAVDRPDPQNRAFEHPDPIDWTERNRARILSALYTILLGNPMLKQPRDAEGRTRFKVWYRLVGSALEHAAKLVKDAAADPVNRETVDQATREKMDQIAAQPNLDFRTLFLGQENDEDSVALADVLAVMMRRWPEGFKANDVADLINREHASPNLDDQTLAEMNRDATMLREFLFPGVPAKNFTAGARSVGRLLANHVDNPVPYGEDILVLRARTVHHAASYVVATKS
jgi:hypothetical protein